MRRFHPQFSRSIAENRSFRRPVSPDLRFPAVELVRIVLVLEMKRCSSGEWRKERQMGCERKQSALYLVFYLAFLSLSLSLSLS